MSQFHYGSIKIKKEVETYLNSKCLNSTMVRLKFNR